jgi:hypothetical protein
VIRSINEEFERIFPMGRSDIGTQTGTNGTSRALNSQKGVGAMKPSESGEGHTTAKGAKKPAPAPEAIAPIAK